MTSAQWLPDKVQRLQNHLSTPKAKVARAGPFFPEVTPSDPWVYYLEQTINLDAFRIQKSLSQVSSHDPYDTEHPCQEEGQKVHWLDIKGPVSIQDLQLTQLLFSRASVASPEDNGSA